MIDATSVEIPLRNKNGEIVAYTVVDAADAGWANRWRWHRDDEGYAARKQMIDGRQRTFRLHRDLLGLRPGDPGVDHRDRDRLNNRRTNLRHATKAQNQQNMSSHRDSTSVHRGVSWDRKRRKWLAMVRIDGRNRNLGRFPSEAEAAEVARRARLEGMPYAVD